ncbi:MAG: hypothetical protein ACUVR3_12645 [Candidatus Roseilinea sp.]|uniref:hypothetical protein n=1 Tax=Candidatus Roseilinea sp. TaxID=2838777 RepID=UPI00404B0563
MYADRTPPSLVNHAIALGMSGSVLPAEMDAIEMFYRSRDALSRVDVCPLTDDSLVDLAGRRAYRLERFQSVLVCALPCSLARAAGEAMRVTLARPGDADLWVRTVAQGFSGVDAPSQAEFGMNRPNFHCRNGASYLAWLDGQPAGGGAMFMHEGIVDLGGASTRAQFRQCGVQ